MLLPLKSNKYELYLELIGLVEQKDTSIGPRYISFGLIKHGLTWKERIICVVRSVPL